MTLQPSQYRAVTIGALLAVCAIVVTGVAVRLTGSGLGCDDWPNCNDSQLIDVSSSHAAIEQVNRLFTGLVSAAVIAAVLGSTLRDPRRRDLTRLSVGLVAGVLAQVVLGGITVLVDLHPVAVQGHLLLSMVLVANATVLVRRAGEPDPSGSDWSGGVERLDTVSPATRATAFALASGTSLAVFTGTLVTGAGPHAGDEDVRRFGFHIPTVARVHGVTVMVTIAVALALVWRIRRSRRERLAMTPVISTWLFVAALQATVGYVQYFNGVPELLVGLHVAGATALMVVTTQTVLDTRRPAQHDHARRDSPPALVKRDA
ncbi:MAG TPA: COX15/CtaA family protein [Ilumatobacteraceae bacterium]|nr:COX15/CtaA family protein [Ilumatobacteraceae bacterium]